MNSYSENITASLENSRNCLRRIARNDDTEFSHQSILNMMEKFVKTVNAMDDTILVPCRLMDLKVGDENDPTRSEKRAKGKKHTVQELLNSADLFQVYNLLNKMKADLLWGQGCDTEDISSGKEVKNSRLSPAKGHARRPSTVSVASTNSSSAMSDTESDASTETDSGIEDPQEDAFGSRTDLIALNFRRHLVGLTRSLKQMTEVAQYLTERYQHDIGGPV